MPVSVRGILFRDFSLRIGLSSIHPDHEIEDRALIAGGFVWLELAETYDRGAFSAQAI